MESAEDHIIDRFLSKEVKHVNTASVPLTVRIEGTMISHASYIHLLEHEKITKESIIAYNVGCCDSVSGGGNNGVGGSADSGDSVDVSVKGVSAAASDVNSEKEEDSFQLPSWLEHDLDIQTLMNGEIPLYKQTEGNMTEGNTRYNTYSRHMTNRRQGSIDNIKEDDKCFIVIVIGLSLFGLAGSAAALPAGCSIFTTIVTSTVGGFGGGLSVRLWKAVSSGSSSLCDLNRNNGNGSAQGSAGGSGSGQDSGSQAIRIVDGNTVNGQSVCFNHRIIEAISYSIRKGPMGWIIGALIGVLISYSLASSRQLGCGEKGIPGSNVDIFSGLPLPAQTAYLAILLSSPALFEALRSAITACLLLLIMAVGAIMFACIAAQAIEKFHEASGIIAYC